MEFKELSVAELAAGYTKSENGKQFTCIFCGETFEDGLIYTSRGRMVTAERAALEHVYDVHQGVFNSLISLDKQISGLSEAQKDILNGMYHEKENKELGEELGISNATVRTHKFNIQKMKREAKILLALLEQIENEEVVRERKNLFAEGADIKIDTKNAASESEKLKLKKDFNGNNLHPFFTQYNLK